MAESKTACSRALPSRDREGAVARHMKRATIVRMMRNCIVIALAACVAWCVTRPADIPFAKHTVDLGANETCAIADINGDKRPDIVSGENWYEAPKWTQHKFRS